MWVNMISKRFKKGQKVKVTDGLGNIIKAVYIAQDRYSHHVRLKKSGFVRDWYLSDDRIVDEPKTKGGVK